MHKIKTQAWMQSDSFVRPLAEAIRSHMGVDVQIWYSHLHDQFNVIREDGSDFTSEHVRFIDVWMDGYGSAKGAKRNSTL